MTPQNDIAERQRPHDYRRAAGVVCYESFTLKVLFVRDVVATFARVMTETFTDLSRAAGAAVRALRGNHRPVQFSARNLLFLTPTSDLRNLPTAN